VGMHLLRKEGQHRRETEQQGVEGSKQHRLPRWGVGLVTMVCEMRRRARYHGV
jgi:hypothetical protein